MRLSVATAGAVVALAVVAGCGSGGNGGGSGLTKAEFVARVDAICAKRTKQIAADINAGGVHRGGPQETNGPTLDDPVAQALLTNYQGEVDEIRSLAAPNGDERTVEAMLDAMEQGVREARASGARGEPLFPAGNQLARGRELSEKYGLEGCVGF